MTNAELVSYYTPAAPFEVVHAGTEADPYTVEEALFIGKSLTESKYNGTKKGNEYGQLKDCYVKGIVTDVGTYNETNKAQDKLKIKDNAEGKELLVFTANFLDASGNADANGRVYLNDEVVVKGALMLYSGTVEISSVVTYEDALDAEGHYVVKSTAYPSFGTITRGKNAVTLGAHEGATVAGLPTEPVTNGSMVENVTVTADSGKVVKAVKANGVALTAVDGKYSFKVEGPVTFVVVTEDEGGGTVTTTDVTMDVSKKTTHACGEVSAANALAYFKQFLPEDKQSLLTAVEVTKIYDGNPTGGWKADPSEKTENVDTTYFKTGTGSVNGYIKLTFAEGTRINKVAISAHAWTTSSTDNISVNGSANQAATKDAQNYGVLTFELDQATNVIEITFAKRCFVNSIVLSVID